MKTVFVFGGTPGAAARPSGGAAGGAAPGGTVNARSDRARRAMRGNRGQFLSATQRGTNASD